MIQVLSQPVDQIDIHDIESLIKSRVPEGEQIEFKEALPAKGQTPDPWMNNQKIIGDYAKKKILEEAVAFANAYLITTQAKRNLSSRSGIGGVLSAT